MADAEPPKRARRRRLPATADPLDMAMAEAARGEGSATARRLLEAHERLASAQLQLAHNELLRNRMRMARDLGLAVLVLGLVAALAWAVMSAAASRAIVVEAFSVPPELARRGLTGQVVAQRFLDHLGDIQRKSNSIRAPASFAESWGGNLKVEIPTTGVSLDDASKALRGWLSDDTRVTGEIVTQGNELRISARTQGDAPAEAAGPAAAFDAVLRRTAEEVFGRQQPYLYAIYLQNEGRGDESLAITKEIALHGPPDERAWGFNSWGLRLQRGGEIEQGAARFRDGVRLDPLPPLLFNLMADQHFRGREGRAAGMLEQVDQAYAVGADKGRLNAEAAGTLRTEIDYMRSMWSGDYLGAEAAARRASSLTNYNNNLVVSPARLAAALAAQHRPGEALRELALAPLTDADRIKFGGPTSIGEAEGLARIASAVADRDWRRVEAEAARLERWQSERGGLDAFRARVTSWPWLARARAELGDVAGAAALAARTPIDCTLCLRVRGYIAMRAGRDGEADRWFAAAVQTAPKLPHAYADRAELRLRRGEFAGALALAERASQLGPDWADPLLIAGDALAKLGRGEEALARYASAAERAPRWSALHVQWGKALWRSGRRDEARAKFGAAAGMDLNPAERARLGRLLAIARSET